MAQVTSGSVTTNSYDGRYYKLDWTSTQSIANNQTTISWTLSAVGGSSSWYAERTLTVVIGGVTAYSKSARVERYAGTVTTGTRVVNHNSAGDAHIDISIQAAVYTSSVNCTGSGSFDLKNIPRASAFGTIEGNTIGGDVTVNITRKNSSFTHQLWYKVGNSEWYDLGQGIGTSKTFTIDIQTCAQYPNATSGVMQLCIRTFNGTAQVGSDVYKNVTVYIPSSVAPSISLSATESTAISWGVYVQGNSQLDIVITPTTMYGATIKSYKTTIDDKSYTTKDFTTDILKNSGSIDIVSVITDSRGRTATYEDTIEVLPYNPPQIKNLKVVRCNSDGTTNTKGAYAKVTYDYAFSSCGGNNSLEVVAQYKTKAASAYTTHATDNYTSASLEGSVTEIFAASTSSQYDIQIVATDAICELFEKTSPTATASIGTISTFYSMFKQLGFAFGKVFDTSKPNSLQVGWDIYDKYDTQIRNGMAAYSSAGIDANTTLEHHILTQTNTPNGTFHHVITYFYNDKTVTSNRVQTAIPYKTPTVTYHRYYLNGVWSEWLNDGLAAYPVGSYYISGNSTSPADLFGGTWQRIEGRILYGCASTGTIGATGTHKTGTGMSELPYVNVAIWRRTA